MWLDGSWDKPCPAWQLDRLYSLVKTLQPGCQFGVNLTVGKFNANRKKNPSKRYLPARQRQYDPLHMFPSDFRLWDPYMCAENDPKLFRFNGETYYLPFEQTLCSRNKGTWFYCDRYEDAPLQDVGEMVCNYRILEKNNNIMVLNLPPNKAGRLVESDVEQLMRIARELGVART